MYHQNNGYWKLSDEEMLLVFVYTNEFAKNLEETVRSPVGLQARETANEIYTTLETIGYFKKAR